MRGEGGRCRRVLGWARALFEEDPDEPLPREWVILALLGSTAAVWLGGARGENSGNPLLRWASDDFLLNILAGLALVGPGLVLTNLVARRLAGSRRMAEARQSLGCLLKLGLAVATGVQVAYLEAVEERARSVGAVPALGHAEFADNARELLCYLRGTAKDLSRVPRSGESASPPGSSLSPAEESGLVQVRNWPAVGSADRLTHEIDKLAATFGPAVFDHEKTTQLDEVLGRPYVSWQPGPGQDARFRLRRAPLQDGMLLSRAEYAFAASGLSLRAATLIESVIDMLPRSVKSVALPGR